MNIKIIFLTILLLFTGKLYAQKAQPEKNIQLYAKLRDNSNGFTRCNDGTTAGTFIFKIISSTDSSLIPGNTISVAVICPVHLQYGLNINQGYHLTLFDTPNFKGTPVVNLLEDGGASIRKHNKTEQIFWTNIISELTPSFIRMVEVKQGIADFPASELNKENPLNGDYSVTCDTKTDRKTEGILISRDNFSVKTKGEDYLKMDSVGVFVDTTTMGYYDNEFKGYRMYVYNASKFPVTFPSIDNDLLMIAQAQDANGIWHDIERITPSGCGNSYYDVFLTQGNQWSLTAPLPSGKLQTKVRMSLYYKTSNGGKVVFSNEYSASINLGQLVPKE